MARRFLHKRLLWLGLLIQLIFTTSSAAGLVLCVEEYGRVAIETRLTQLACCGDVSAAHHRSHDGPVLIEDDACADAPLSLAGVLSKPDSDGFVDAFAWTPVLATAAIGHPAAARTRLQLPPTASPPDRALGALSTVILLV